MSRAPARLAWTLAALAVGGCAVAGPRPTGDALPGEDAEIPDVRVGIAVEAAEVRVEGQGAVELADQDGRVRDRGGGPWTVTRSGGRLVASGRSVTIRVTGGLLVRPAGGRVRVDGTGYHGAVLLQPGGAGVTAINLVDLETYLRGVVPLEIGAGRPPEALEAVKAQAVAARTYAVRQLGRREALGFDYHGTVLDQAYGGADAEDAMAARAVEATRGEILTYNGEAIEAYYHSTCGGQTAAVEEVWVGEPRPYLRSVSDRRADGGWYCEASTRFRWTEEWDEPALLEALTTGLRGRGMGPFERVEALEITGRTASGRAEALVVRTGRGTTRVHGDSIRRVLRPEPGRILNSTAIELEPRGDGRVTGLTVRGSGWGHGIGMCQMGALGRALDGHDYRDILSTYYPGTRLVRLYP